MTLMNIVETCICYVCFATLAVLAGILIYGVGKWLLGGYDESPEEMQGGEDWAEYLDNSEYDWGHDVRNYKSEDYD